MTQVQPPFQTRRTFLLTTTALATLASCSKDGADGGAKEVELPLFRVVDNANVETPELQDADFLKGWFGIIRKIGPTQTEEGRMLFDVAPKNYKLEVTDGGEVGKEQLAFIDIPIDFDTSEPVQAVPESSTKK